MTALTISRRGGEPELSPQGWKQSIKDLFICPMYRITPFREGIFYEPKQAVWKKQKVMKVSISKG